MRIIGIVPDSSWGLNFVVLSFFWSLEDDSTEMYWMGMS